MKYPIGIQSFESLRREGYVYVDKTARMYDLTSMGKFYFLSRPRRFGKSLLLSTLEAYFEGKKDLFKGLALEKLEHEWTKYPILYLDLNTGEYDNIEGLDEILNINLIEWEQTYGSLEAEKSPGSRFMGVVKRAYEATGKQVVILVDEYDKPILSAINDEPLQEKFRRKLKSFYSVLKTQDRYIRFAFITGVSKFSHLSIFSDLNNLKDITLDKRYADICGISEMELHTYFEDSIKALADNKNITYDEACAKLKEMYDGYHFAPNSVGMYNPFSLLNALDQGQLGNYWYKTGTPTFLVQMLKDNDYNLNNLEKEIITEDMLGGVETLKDSPIPILYQTGYLTIKGYDERFDGYRLSFPNGEVEYGFLKNLLPYYVDLGDKSEKNLIVEFIRAVESGKPEIFLSRMKTFLDGSDYRVAGKSEIYFQSVTYLIFKLMGVYTQVEYATSDGRIDVVIQTKDYIYLIELKVDSTADKALAQIESKDYAKAFASDKRTLYKIGVCFSSETRSINDYKITC